MPYSESMNYGEPYSTSYDSERKDRRKMTCLIHTKYNGGIIVASDSWNTNPQCHSIQKMTYNEKFPCIIASAGENSALYENGKIIKVMDFMHDFVNDYKGTNINICIDKLYQQTYSFLYDMNLSESYEKVVQYFVVYYDLYSKNITSKALEMVKNHNGIFSYDLSHKVNMGFTSFGTYAYPINIKYMNTEEIIYKEDVFSEIRYYCQLEKDLPSSMKHVGGKIQYIYMNRNGKIDSNLSY